ncbi:MAG TPA: outer membrane protein assembly factor BamD [Desulfobacterales bacterium]|nr:outer membrane protein assembly factor BamD [Desulfobacterales bacterium]
MKRHFIICFIFLFLCSGCAWFQSREEKSAVELASDGMDEFKNGNYRNAIESFEKLKNWYPFSKYSILAELKIADSHYMLHEYEEAIFAYEDFENLHPRNEAIPYVIYQIGRCYFEQILTVDRDQTSAQKALDTFRRLERQFPSDPHTIKAQSHIKECLASLAGHELYVGMFYYKSKRYEAALKRFKAVILNYPDVGIHHEALKYISLCETELKKSASAE